MLAPPWGGLHYDDANSTGSRKYFDLSQQLLEFGNGIELVRKALKISSRVVYILPRNTKLSVFHQLEKEYQTTICIEKIFIHQKHKMNVIYIGFR